MAGPATRAHLTHTVPNSAPGLPPPSIIRAPRGAALTARSWQTEAPLRMLHNNLDPEFAERPDDLVVYGGTGRAARDWRSSSPGGASRRSRC